MKQATAPCLYILASSRNGTLYVGVTGNLGRRMEEHSKGLVDGFTKKYDVKMLVYHDRFLNMEVAILREKRIKEWRREWKVQLIEAMNPEWTNLYDATTGEILPGPTEAERLSADPVRDCDQSGSRFSSG